MIFYKCDLCGHEQDIDKVEPTRYDPTGKGYRLPFKTDNPILSKVDHICGGCYGVISDGRKQMMEEANQKINEAMADKALKLFFEHQRKPVDDDNYGVTVSAHHRRAGLAFKLAWLNLQEKDPALERFSLEHKQEYLRLLGDQE